MGTPLLQHHRLPALGLLMFGLSAGGAAGAQGHAAACTALADDHARLACYDRALGRPAARAEAPSAPATGPAPGPASTAPPAAAMPTSAGAAGNQPSYLAQRWDLVAAPGSDDPDAHGPPIAPRP